MAKQRAVEAEEMSGSGEEEYMLDSDSEVDEFEEERAVAQYQPDEWDGADDDDSEDESEDDEVGALVSAY